MPGTSPTTRVDRPIRVLHVNDHLGYEGGVAHGGTTLLLSMLKRFDPERVRGSLCILGDWHDAAPHYETEGFPPIFLGRAKWDPRALPDLVGLVRRLEVDVLHLHTMKAFLLGRVVAALTGCRAVVHFHDVYRPGPLVGTVQRRLVPWTAAALAVSSHVREMAIDAYGLPPRLVRVLYNGVDVSGFADVPTEAGRRLREEWGISPQASIVGVLGRIMRGKGQEVLVRQIPRILATRPATVFIFIGDGSLRERCEELSRQLGVNESVRFLGHRDDVPAVLSAVEVLALPSVLEEGFPLSAIEGMSAGCAVVAFRVGGMGELVGDSRAAILVKKGDADAFADAVLRLIERPELRCELADRGRARALDFDMSVFTRQLENLYLGVLDPARPRPGRTFEADPDPRS